VSTDDEEYRSRELNDDSIHITISVNDEVVFCRPSMECYEHGLENSDYEFLYNDIILNCHTGKHPDISFSKYGDIYYNMDTYYDDSMSHSTMTCSYKVKLIELKQ
jgi:hypothetical protein